MPVDTVSLDQRIAALLEEQYHPYWHSFTSEPEHAERLVEWLRERGVAPVLAGASITFMHRRTRLFCVTGDTVLIALARGAVRVAHEHPELVSA